MKLITKIASLSSVALLLSTPLVSMAAVPCPAGQTCPTTGNITSVNQIFDLINRIVGYIQALFWIGATVFIFYAAYLYLTAAGDPEKVGAARSQLIYAVVAMAVALIAFAIPTIIQSFLGGQ